MEADVRTSPPSRIRSFAEFDMRAQLLNRWLLGGGGIGNLFISRSLHKWTVFMIDRDTRQV